MRTARTQAGVSRLPAPDARGHSLTAKTVQHDQRRHGPRLSRNNSGSASFAGLMAYQSTIVVTVAVDLLSGIVRWIGTARAGTVSHKKDAVERIRLRLPGRIEQV
jgi:hypothetical protein